jgi:hypothetical protein
MDRENAKERKSEKGKYPKRARFLEGGLFIFSHFRDFALSRFRDYPSSSLETK